jgi:HAD superfamily hydrolase (TIGR01549 family)
MIRGVLLDLDDTLFDHRFAARQALDAVRQSHACFQALAADDLEHRHAELLEELHLRVIAGEIGLDAARQERFRRLLLSAGVDASPDLAAATAAAYRDRYQQSWQEVEGATALLRALRGRVRVGIVSNNLTREQHDKLRFCGFDALLDVVIISESAGVSKPDPEIFRIAMRQLGTTADDTVMLGDAWNTDIIGARAAGLRAIWFNPRHRPRPEPADDVVEIASLDPAVALPAILRRVEDDRDRTRSRT